MKASTLIILSIIYFPSIWGQHYKNDTVDFKKYKVVICDQDYAPFSSRNIFPKNRFKPEITIADSIEKQLPLQYANAYRIFFIRSYKQVKETKFNYTKEEFRRLKFYYRKSNINRMANESQNSFLKRSCDFDREYYGILDQKNNKYINIIFVPHKPEYVEIPGTGEAILDNLPNMTYDLTNSILYLSGWDLDNNN